VKRVVLPLLIWSLVVPSVTANVVGTDAQNFNAITSGVDFVTVQSSETLTPGVFNFGLFVNYAVNTLPYYEGGGSNSKNKKYRDSLTAGDINFGIGLTRNWDLGLSLPQILHQDVKDKSDRSEFAQNGNSEVRLNTKYRLWGKSSYGVAVIGTFGLNRIENNPYVGDNGGPTTTLEIAGDMTIKRIAIGANIGHRWRDPGEPISDYPIKPMQNQFIASAAASYHLKSIRTKIITEVFAGWPTKKVDADVNRQMSSAEAILGMKYDVTSNMALHLGGGTELKNGVSSPDYRVYAGTNICLGPVWGGKELKKRVARKPKLAPAPAAPEPLLEPEAPEVDLNAPPQADTIETIVIRSLLFVFDSDTEVLEGSKNELSKIINYMQKPPVFTKLVIEGHTDYLGSVEYNRDLSQRRADAAKRYLVRKYNLPADKIEAVGYGESRPVADNGNYQGRQLNRRVELKIYR
jgi:outer membrane protein OmpA-like peptidoglycan-associated protein